MSQGEKGSYRRQETIGGTRQTTEATTARPSAVREIFAKVRDVSPKEAALDATKSVGAALPPVAIGLDAVAKLFDTSEAKAVKKIGDSHLEAAKKAIADAEKDPEGEHLQTAEQSLRTTYELAHTEIGSIDNKVLSPVLSTKDTRAAYQRATEAALIIAMINEGTPTAETWAEHAREDFDAYDTLTERAAEKGIRKGKKAELLEQLALERAQFAAIYEELVPPEISEDDL